MAKSVHKYKPTGGGHLGYCSLFKFKLGQEFGESSPYLKIGRNRVINDY